MSLKQQYQDKLVTAEQAVSTVASGDIVDYGYFNGKPVDCDKALAQRAGELENVSIYTAVSLPPIPESDQSSGKLYLYGLALEQAHPDYY